MTIPLPIVLDSNLNESKRVRPISLSVNLNIIPLSTASLQLPKSETIPARSYVKIYTSLGFAGIFRVRAPQEAYGADTITVEMEHAVTEIADYLVKDQYDKKLGAQTAIKTIFSHYKGSKWKLGSVSALSGYVLVNANYNTVLEAILAVLDQLPGTMMTFDFSQTPWVLNFAKRDTAVTAEGRLSRNVRSAQITYDDSELCTRAYAEGLPGSTETNYGYVDASTKSKYGIIERTVSTGSDYTQEQALMVVNSYLESHKEPKVSISIDAQDLSSITGEAFDTFTLGKLFCLALPDYGTTVTKNITALSWGNVYDQPEDVKVTLADEKDTVISFLHEVETTGGRSGGGGGRKQNKKFKEYRTHFDQNDKQIKLTAERVDKNENILEQAGLELNSKGVLIYATNKKNQIGSQFKVLSDGLSSEVKKTGTGKLKNGETLYSRITQNANKIELKVGKGDVISSINQTAERIKIKANKIELDGYVKMGTSYTDYAKLGYAKVNEFVDSIDVNGDVFCQDIDCGTVLAQGYKTRSSSYTATWQNKSVVTSITRSDTRQFMYAKNGNISNPATTTGSIVTDVTTDTIYYLGRE